MPQITIENHNMTINGNPAMNLLNNFLINDAPIHTVCGGRAQCGCCRIKIVSENKGISPVSKAETKKLGVQLIDEGWRLSCQTHILRDITVYMPTVQELAEFCG